MKNAWKLFLVACTRLYNPLCPSALSQFSVDQRLIDKGITSKQKVNKKEAKKLGEDLKEEKGSIE